MERAECAVHIATRADALYDFLPQVASFGKVQGAGLSGLLRKLAIADIGAKARRSFENSQPLETLRLAEDSTGLLESFEKFRCGVGIGPEFKARDEWAVE